MAAGPAARAAARSAPPQPAFVLHQWDWSETSLVLDLFTRAQGRVAVVAKGAKRPYSQLRAVLLPFQCVAVQLSRPKAGAAAAGDASADAGGEPLLTLRGAEYAGRGLRLPAAALMSGFYCNELLQKLLPRHDPQPALWDAYADALQALGAAVDGVATASAHASAATSAPDAEAAALRAFELVLLQACGLLPELDRVTPTQAALRAEGRYQLDPEHGLVPSPAEGLPPLSGAHCLALQAALEAPALAQRGAALRAAALAAGGALPALRAQLRAALAYHLGSPRLRTRQLMLQLRRLSEHPGTVPPVAAAQAAR